MRLTKRFFADLLGAQLDGVRFARALPLVFLAMAALEFAQHVMEIRIGFFDSREAARAVANDSARMTLGWIKMILVYAAGFLAIRYLVWNEARRAMAVSGRSLRAYLPYVLYSLALFALTFYSRPLLAIVGLGASDPAIFQTVIGLSQLALEPVLMLWIVSAATDHAAIGPLESIKRTGMMYFWALALFFIGRLPINAAHQLLNFFAVGQPPAVLWPMLAIDALAVGLLAAIVPAIYVRVARFILERHAGRALTAAYSSP